MTNLIDRMGQVAEALKAAGDDIAARRVANARRDRTRGLITPTAADAALSVAEKRLAALIFRRGDDVLSVPGSVIGTEEVPHTVGPEVDPGAEVRRESSAFAASIDPPRRELPFRRTFEKRIIALPYVGGGYHSTGMTLAELRGLVATLTQAGCPDDRFVKISTTDGNPPELIIDAGGWRIEK